jgi:hypothetical protein
MMLWIIAATAVVGIVVWLVAHRTSPLVRQWHRSSFPRRAAGPLSVVDSGPSRRPNEETIVLLHALGSSGDYFGASFDGLSNKRSMRSGSHRRGLFS